MEETLISYDWGIDCCCDDLLKGCVLVSVSDDDWAMATWMRRVLSRCSFGVVFSERLRCLCGASLVWRCCAETPPSPSYGTLKFFALALLVFACM